MLRVLCRMNKITSIINMAILLSISGCQLANNAKTLTDNNGVGAFSCDQIRSYFSAYDADRQSVTAYTALAQATGLNTTNVNTQTVDTYYSQAKQHANIALLVQGCAPI